MVGVPGGLHIVTRGRSPTASITGGALMPEPDLLLADEPTSSLDLKTSIEILELISRRTSESSIPAIVNNTTSIWLAATPLALLA